jgi:leucyl-tRNA synthetase
MYLMFLAPFEQGGDFRDSGILGISRFLERVWKFKPGEKNGDESLFHRTIKKVTGDIELLRYNTAISALMILLNSFEDKGASKNEYETFLKLLAPFAPHITEELWEKLGNEKSIHLELWPEHDSKLIEENVFELVVQINGKTKATIVTEKGLSQKEAEELALGISKINDFLSDKKPKKIIFVPDRLINFVI